MEMILAVVLGLAAPGADTAPALSADFATGRPADYFTADSAGRVRVASAGKTQTMILSDGACQLRDAAVQPGRKYTLTLTAAFEGDAESMEDNPRFEVFARPGQTSPRLPSRRIEFLDAAGKPTGRPLLHAMPFRNRHTYEDVFYTPAEAAAVRIGLASGKGVRLILSALRVSETPDEGALNVNPAFGLGLCNYSGWRNIAAGGCLIRREGKVVLDTKYGSVGQKIPLSKPGTYALSAKATGNGYNSVVIVRVYDRKDKKLMQASTRRYGPRTYFVLPADAAYASFLVYSCLLEEARLVWVGDEKAIQSLRKK